MKILLLSAYTASSHQYWIDGLLGSFPEYQWTVLSLPPRHFSWRIRGNSLLWATSKRRELSADYDLVLATSMVDLAGLRGLVPTLASIPTLVYFHENQFVFPVAKNADVLFKRSIEAQLVNLYTALCADRLIFNSRFNRDSFAQGIAKLLHQLPDQFPNHLVSDLLNKSVVIPVPLTDALFSMPQARTQPPDRIEIVWNHRWEHDKAPERLLALLLELGAESPLTVNVVGQQFRQQPPEFELIRQLLTERNWLGQWGYIPVRQTYYQLLSRAHFVLSTAVHDFQGLSILEGVALGCVPIVPNRLAYQDFIPESYRYASIENDVGKEAINAADKLTQLIANLNCNHTAVAVAREMAWEKLKTEYEKLFQLGNDG